MNCACCLFGQEAGQGILDAAYKHLQEFRLVEARVAFEAALQGNPDQANARLDYAYLLLRMGETEQGRNEIKRVLLVRPGDERLSLEYAYLAYETGKKAEAFKVFLRLKLAKDGGIREQASETWERLDGDLKASIARWTEAVRKSPESYSVHEELARLLEDRNDWVGAADEYRLAFGLKLDKRRFLLDIARVEVEAMRFDYEHAALLAASRGTQPMVAEEAREFLPPRYPYVYEFQMAVEMDPLNVAVRRELGFLLLKMGREKDAIDVFGALLKLAPEDALSVAQLAFLRVSKPASAAARAAGDSGLTAVKDLAARSIEKGYLKDALKYLEQMHESNPEDDSTTLRLAWTYNMVKRDQDAMRLFEIARRSRDAKIAGEADQAYRNLRPSLAPVRTTTWMLPFYSSRWNEVFAYGQAKMEFRLPKMPLRPYLSSRLIGDLGRSNSLRFGPTGQGTPQALSESAIVLAAGIATPSKHGLTAWGEVGGSWQYFAAKNHTAKIRSDYRGGVNFSKAIGAANLSSEGGWFAMSTADAVYLSRFDNNTLFYGQNRIGYHAPSSPLQFYINLNITTDLKRMDWANYYEIGPGVRWRAPGMPKALYLFADYVYGRHMLKGDGLRSRRFADLRVGVWYALTY